MYLNINPTIKKYCELSGYTEKAVYRKIEDGIWQEKREYIKAPDGRIWILLEGVNKWATKK